MALTVVLVVSVWVDTLVVHRLPREYLLNPDAYAWYQIWASYYVLNWLLANLLILAIPFSAVKLLSGAEHARAGLMLCTGVGLVATATTSGTRTLLWVQDGGLQRLAPGLRVEAALSGATLVLEVAILWILWHGRKQGAGEG